MKPGINIATEYAKIFKIEAKKDEESEADFRGRVAGILRNQNHLIEAHEALNNERYEESNDVMTGIMGAAAMALQGKDYGSEGEHLIDDEFAAGTIVQAPKKDEEALLLLALLMGGGRR